MPEDVDLTTIRKQDKSIGTEQEYKLSQFNRLLKELEPRIPLPLLGRKYIERLQSKALNSRINQELEYGPKVYLG